MGWAEAETDGASLPDARLKRRLSRVLEPLSAQPTESIPAASGIWADTKAAYRLFDNDRVDAVDILDGHIEFLFYLWIIRYNYSNTFFQRWP